MSMERTCQCALDVDGPDASFRQIEKDRGKKSKRRLWLLLLKVHVVIGPLASLGDVLIDLLTGIKKRLASGLLGTIEKEKIGKGPFFLRLILGFLVMAVSLLALELMAHFKGWQQNFLNLHRHDTRLDFSGGFEAVYVFWLKLRVDYIAAPVRALADICVVLFILQCTDRILQCLGCLWIKFRKIKPRIEGNPFKLNILDGSEPEFPMVLVQIPMCNERQVYKQSISSVCRLDWPKEKLLIQVLDDSDEESIQGLIKEEVSKWKERGVNILYRHRSVRTGYKAGNLKAAMDCDYVKDYEFVAIFDADFQPMSDFLRRTIPHFKENPELGLVQARWAFVNKDENLLTRLQNINMCFHFEVEQQVNGVFINFFGFNGTAGVWRIKALEDAGGWSERTTVEDMDLAVRAHLHGWKFIFLNDVKVPCELPECYESYRRQQHRWHSGPIHLFRLCLPAMFASRIALWKKANLLLLFFLLRKLILPFYSFTMVCIVLPLTVFVPEASLSAWVICYVPVAMSFLNILPAPTYFPFGIPYLLFENTMSVIKFHATISGLFQLGSSYEWTVTKKSGRLPEAEQKEMGSETKDKISKWKEHEDSGPEPGEKKMNKIYEKEIALGFLLLAAAFRSLLSAQMVHFYVLVFQGAAFLISGLDLIGEQMS